MSEQLIQNNLYSENVSILGKYECLSLGSTTIKQLINLGYIKNINLSNKAKNKKPDVLIIDNNKNIIIYIEQKLPINLKNENDIKKAIEQELFVAKEVNAKIYIVSDGTNYYWINPLTGNPIKNENDNLVTFQIKPKENEKESAKLINDVLISINNNNDKILKREFLDPTDLAIKINKILVNVTFASAKMSLYTFVELFLFKYLSDIGILGGENSFNYIASMYKEEYKKIDNTITEAKILGKYIDGARETMKTLFPSGDDGTSIINGQVFHVKKDEYNEYISEDNTDKIFKEVILAFENYEKEKGKFININSDFKSKLFETFMKNSDEKSNMGQFFTPLKIVNEMVNMIDITEGMSICDPACGVGKFILEAIESKIQDYYTYNSKEKDEKNKLKKSINIIGFDKMMSEKDDLTIILAKANMLIYFSELFKKNNNLKDIKIISENLLNKSYYLYSTMLGTLGELKEDKYDLILANPPYYQSALMMSEAKKTGNYTLNGGGVESLFLEWILKSLKPNGVANIVLPDGIFSNKSNNIIKEYILNNFFIDSIISLPVGAFFNTPKKTYILTVRKFNKREKEENIKQNYPVFTYITTSIGETLDSYRFDIEENDLKEAVIKYNLFKREDKNNLNEPIKSYIESDIKLKLIDIENFDKNESWIIENFWSEEEKIKIGLKKEKNIATIDEFTILLDDMISLMNEFKEELEWIK